MNVLNASGLYTLKRLIMLCEFYLIKDEEQGEKTIFFSLHDVLVNLSSLIY